MTIESIFNYLISSKEGLVILSLLTVVITGALYEIIKRRFFFIGKLLRRHLLMKAVVKTSEGFELGYRLAKVLRGYRVQRTVLRILHVVIFIFHILLILILGLIGVIATLLTPSNYIWVIVIIFSFIFTIQYKKLRLHLEIYQMAIKIVYQRREEIEELIQTK